MQFGIASLVVTSGLSSMFGFGIATFMVGLGKQEQESEAVMIKHKEDYSYMNRTDTAVFNDQSRALITPFDEKLIELGIKETYDHNRKMWVAQNRDNTRAKFGDWSKNFQNFIMWSFVWENTPEGYIFWNYIANTNVL